MKINKEIKDILNLKIEIDEIIFSKEGIRKHILKRKHYDVLKYFDEIENIINFPDYVGINPNVDKKSFECIKCLDKNVLVAIKINKTKNNFYIASMYTINDHKLKSRILSGRIKKFDKNIIK